VRDLRFIEAEMLLADLDMIERRIEKLKVQVTKPTPTQKQDRLELEVLQRCQEAIEHEKPVKSLQLSKEEEKAIRGFRFLSGKDAVVVVNIGDEQEPDPSWGEKISKDYSEVMFVHGRIEAEIAELDEADRAEFLADMGVKESARNRLIRASLEALGMGNFFTVGDDEVKAWPLAPGDTALDCAGKIHSDLARGFIRAEVVHFEDLRKLGSMKEVKAQNKVHLEGKDYAVADGDILNIRFSV